MTQPLIDAAANNIFDPRQDDGDQRLGQAVAGLQAIMAEAMAIFPLT